MTLPSFPFYPQSFLAATHDMSADEVGGYIRLLCFQWDRGGLPNDGEKLARMAGCNGNAIAMLRHKFKKGEDGLLRNERLEQEREKAAENSRKQSDKAIKRWRTPSTPASKAIAALFNRRLDTEWSEKEVRRFRSLVASHFFDTMDDFEMVARYTIAERKKAENGKHRRDLYTFLNNYPGEVDRAREWATKNPVRSKAVRFAPPKPPEPKLSEEEVRAALAEKDRLMAELREKLRSPAQSAA